MLRPPVALHLVNVRVADTGIFDVDEDVVIAHRTAFKGPRTEFSGGIEGRVALDLDVLGFFRRKEAGRTRQKQPSGHRRFLHKIPSGFVVGVFHGELLKRGDEAAGGNFPTFIVKGIREFSVERFWKLLAQSSKVWINGSGKKKEIVKK